MFGKYQGLFRSRWKALWWALGVCVSAYFTVPSEEGKPDPLEQAAIAAAGAAMPDAAHRELTPEEQRALENVEGLSGGTPPPAPEAAPSRHVNPWALPGKG